MYYNARWYDPYLNRFTQPDSIVPDPSNSQAWDRYAYGLNNPSRFTDPTGHKIEEGCGCEIPKPQPPEEKPWRYSKDVDAGFHIGPTGDMYVPNYDDDTYNGFPWVYSQNEDDNFWVHFNVTYDESVGITISDLTLVNYSDYPATLSAVKFESGDTSVIPPFTEFEMPHGWGSDFTFPGLPEPFNGNYPVTITIEVGWTVSVGHDPFQIHPDYHISLPSLPSLKCFIETGKPPPTSLILP